MSDRILRLQSSWSYYRRDDGKLELACIPLAKRLSLSGAAASEAALAALADGVDESDAAAEVATAAAISREQAQRLIDQLESIEALVRRNGAEDVIALDGSGLYDRQVRFLSFYETAVTTAAELNGRLQNRTVVIPGVGGIGGWIALLCARLGVRSIVGIDPDRVELSNLHRQILYTREDVGEFKVNAARDRLTDVDPEIEFVGHATWIEAPDDARPLLEGADLVINAFPYLPSFVRGSHAVANAALEAGVPCLHMPMAQCVGPLTVPGVTACHQCGWDQLSRVYNMGDALRASTPVGSRRGYLGALAPRQAIVGGLAAWEAVRFLSGLDRTPTLDGLAFVDIGAYQQHQFVPLQRDPECSACGHIVADSAAGALGPAVAGNSPDAWRR
jgi:molybdopterin/thiamine biosynthesis adenylyltransferase